MSKCSTRLARIGALGPRLQRTGLKRNTDVPASLRLIRGSKGDWHCSDWRLAEALPPYSLFPACLLVLPEELFAALARSLLRQSVSKAREQSFEGDTDLALAHQGEALDGVTIGGAIQAAMRPPCVDKREGFCFAGIYGFEFGLCKDFPEGDHLLCRSGKLGYFAVRDVAVQVYDFVPTLGTHVIIGFPDDVRRHREIA